MNVVDLGDAQSLESYRSGIITDLPEILGSVGFTEQASNVENGRNTEFLAWYTGAVAIEGHGATDNAVGLTAEQTAKFNPYAVRHRLMGPVELWTPDNVTDGNLVGDIKVYETFPEIDRLIPEAYKARRSFVVAALFRGIAGRVEAAVQLAARNEGLADGLGYEFVVLSGQREPTKADLGGGAYKEYFTEANGDEQHDMALLKDEPTMVEAIFRKNIDLEDEPFEIIEDRTPDAPENSHPDLGPRQWVMKRFRGQLKGREVTVTIMNAKAAAPQGQMNRSGWKPNATDALSEWLEHTTEDPSQIAVYNISYAHMVRIAAALHKSGHSVDSRLGRAIPVGNMPLQPTWYTVNKNGHLNGGTLEFKELVPVIQNVNELLGRDKNDFSLR